MVRNHALASPPRNASKYLSARSQASCTTSSASWLFGAFTVGLLISGIVSPAVGGLVDAQGGRFVLSWGSVLGAVALALIASARGFPLLLLGWSLAGVAMAACLYDPAFATLHQLTGTSYRRA